MAANRLQWQGAIGPGDVLKWSVEAPDLALIDAKLAGKGATVHCPAAGMRWRPTALRANDRITVRPFTAKRPAISCSSRTRRSRSTSLQRLRARRASARAAGCSAGRTGRTAAGR